MLPSTTLNRFLSGSCALLVLANFSGCEKQPARFPVAGTVLIDGQPLTEGTLRFVPESGRPFTSSIASDGSFTLTEHSLSAESESLGVMPGVYRVAVTATRVVDEDSGEVEWLVPSRYADFRTSGLQVAIGEAKTDLKIELTSDEAEPKPEGETETTAQPEVSAPATDNDKANSRTSSDEL